MRESSENSSHTHVHVSHASFSSPTRGASSLMDFPKKGAAIPGSEIGKEILTGVKRLEDTELASKLEVRKDASFLCMQIYPRKMANQKT